SANTAKPNVIRRPFGIAASFQPQVYTPANLRRNGNRRDGLNVPRACWPWERVRYDAPVGGKEKRTFYQNVSFFARRNLSLRCPRAYQQQLQEGEAPEA